MPSPAEPLEKLGFLTIGSFDGADPGLAPGRVTAWEARAATLLGAAALLLVAACGGEDASPRTVSAPVRTLAPAPVEPAVSGGPTVQQIADALDAIRPTRHPRDNTGSCAAAAGCLGLVTAGTVSIYQWPSVSAASRFIGEGPGTADRIGPYVLSYRNTEQHATPPQVRRAYADKVRAMVGPVP